ncbi:uroporphyrinogen-III synthase [Sphingomonas sp.]|uniref:uroporphyrinogen-III synthase n=1 Tax=Sphingomonas sp. TaxID=28214 RepID=UPI003AFF8576
MTRPLLVLRPQPSADRTVEAARAIGLEAVAAPLFELRAVAWRPPITMPQAVLMTSASAARLGGDGLGAVTHLPLYAVGDATAEAARAAGFAHVVIGGGDAAAIAATAAADGVTSLLHLAGREHRVVTIPGLGIETRIVYAADAVEALPRVARAVLPDAVALLHSARAAAAFARLAPERARIAVAAISRAALSASGGGWRAAAVASAPTDAALLAAAAKLCDH